MDSDLNLQRHIIKTVTKVAKDKMHVFPITEIKMKNHIDPNKFWEHLFKHLLALTKVKQKQHKNNN